MGNRVAAIAANVLVAGFVTTAVGAEPASITTIAPKDSLAVISVPNWKTMRAAFDQTGLARAWREPSVQRYIDDLMEQAKTDDADLSKVLGRWREFSKEVEEPTGAVGLAIHLAETPSKEEGQPSQKLPHVLMLADFGEGAEKAEREIVALLREGVADGAMKLEEVARDGSVIYTITFVEREPEAKPNDGMADEDDEFDFEFEDEGPEFDHLDTMYMSRVGRVLLLGSHEQTFGTSLRDVQDGRSSGLADEPLFKDAVAQIGSGNHLFATFMLTDSLRSEIRTAMGAGGVPLPLPIPVDIVKVIETAGLSEFKAATIGVKLNTERADMEQHIGLLAGSKKGLFTLLDSDSTAFAPPAFASADATSVGRLTVRFDRVMSVVRELAAAFPNEMKAEVDAGLQTFETQFGPALRALGPNVFTMTNLARPFTATSESQVVAIACADDMAVNNAVGALAQQFGAEARDFQGFQVYDGGFVPFAMGIGAGYLFLGQTEGVENALRAASAPAGAAKLADEARFRQAVAQLPHEGNAYSFVSTKDAIEYSFWQMKNADKIAIEQMRAMGFEISEEDEAEWKDDEAAKWTKNLPPAEDVSKHFGDSIMVVRPTPDGFRFTSMTLRAK